MTATAAFAALATAATGNVALMAMASDSTSNVAPWVQGGGSAAAVAGLVYVARLIAKGELVPRPVRESEIEMAAAIMAAGQREAKVLQIAEAQQIAYTAQQMQHDDVLRLLLTSERSLADVATEMAYWREMRDRGTRREDGRAREDGQR